MNYRSQVFIIQGILTLTVTDFLYSAFGKYCSPYLIIRLPSQCFLAPLKHNNSRSACRALSNVSFFNFNCGHLNRPFNKVCYYCDVYLPNLLLVLITSIHYHLILRGLIPFLLVASVPVQTILSILLCSFVSWETFSASNIFSGCLLLFG